MSDDREYEGSHQSNIRRVYESRYDLVQARRRRIKWIGNV